MNPQDFDLGRVPAVATTAADVLRGKLADRAFTAAALNHDSPERAEFERLQAEADVAVAPPGSVGDFYIPLPEGADDAARAENGAVRGWLHEAGFDTAAGNSLVKLAMEPARQDFTPEQAEASLRKVWAEDFDARMGAARRLVAEVEARRPGLVDFLNRTGLGNNVFFVSQLASFAARRYGI